MKVGRGRPLPSVTLKQLSALWVEIQCHCHTQWQLPRRDSARAWLGPHVGHREAPRGGGGEGRRKPPAPGLGRLAFLRHPVPGRSTSPLSTLACGDSDGLKNQLQLLRVSGPACQAMVGCTN